MSYNSLTTKAARIDYIREAIKNSDAWLKSALLAVYRQQTPDEKNAGTTSHDNGMGFTGFDAKFLSSLAQWVEAGKPLSPKQAAIARKRMVKYVAQLEKISAKNA